MDTNILLNLGFTKVETDIYLDLAKNGESSASEIAARVNISRTYVYDALEHLLKKGVIAFVLKNNRKRFNLLKFEKILEFVEYQKKVLDEQKEGIKNLINELNKLNLGKRESPIVEVLEGPEGLKTILNDIVRTKKDVIGWGATDKIRRYLPEWFLKKYVNEKARKGMKTRQLYVEGEKTLEGNGYINIPISKEFSSPVTFLAYGDRVAIFFWSEIPIVIRVTNKDISGSFKNHFNFLWQSVKK